MNTPATLRLARSSLRAHRRRFLGTFAAVLLGVAFLTGTLVMGDTLRASFDSMFTGATRGTDAVVRSATTVTAAGEAQGTRGPVDDDGRALPVRPGGLELAVQLRDLAVETGLPPG
ncbi:hypothetical protein AB0F16_40020, partial [Streptomyces tanashiensis]